MRYKMNLQLFEDGAGAGSANGQGGNTGTGSGGQNTAGSAAGAHGTGTYTYEHLEYVMFKVSKLVDYKTDFEKAADKFLKENPKFAEKSSGTYRVSTGAQSGGVGGKENSNDFINAAIRRAAGR